MGWLHEDEAPVYELLCEESQSPFLLTADHAGRGVPRALGGLGVAPAEMDRHIAWDIGIGGVTRRLSAALDATAVLQNYSRLVIDCNRQPHVASAFPAVSEATPVPANDGLDEAGKAVRRGAIFDPYHGAIGRLIAERARTVYVAMHSFTPVYLAQARPMHVAVLYNRNPRLSKILATLLRAEGGLVVGENAPYRVSDETDYGVPVHAERGGLDYLEIEIRQDLIAEEAGQAAWAARLARLLPEALRILDAGAKG
ncbi:N-formylglutamate amidohydrolase [Acidocella sp.]|uniref:N-formylglutamate amidohydrolase n=1 Tax=Acidocella sp. TaxID=50710 RepID=UPI003D06BA90